MRRSCILRVGVAAVLVMALVVGGVLYARWDNREWNAFRAYERSLYVALTENAFAEEFSSPEDRERLAKEFAFLKSASTQEELVIQLIRWINENIQGPEVMSVRAVDLLEAKSAACEVHALAAGVLESLGIKARWIGGVKTSIGFGYLEAFVDGRWRLFKLRDPEHISLGKSAWDLYRESEPSLNIRTFYAKPDQSVKAWRGAVYPVVFPFANVLLHPELERLFTTDRGIKLTHAQFDPYRYVFTWYVDSDSKWIEAGDSMDRFEREYLRAPWRKQRLRLDLGLVRFYSVEPQPGAPTPYELRVVIP